MVGRDNRRRLMAAEKKQSILPAGYKAYKWIRCSGWRTGEYIDTGIPNQNGGIRIETTINTIDRSIPDSAVLLSPGNTWVHRLYFNGSAGISWICRTNRGYSTSINQTAFGNKIFKLIVDDGGITADGVLYDTPWSSTAETLVQVNLRLLGCGGTDPNLYFSKGMGETLIYVNDVLVRDYTPCTNANNEAGMYDRVSETFFGNDGTGYFIVSNN